MEVFQKNKNIIVERALKYRSKRLRYSLSSAMEKPGDPGGITVSVSLSFPVLKRRSCQRPANHK